MTAADHHRFRIARWQELQAKATERHAIDKPMREKVERICAFWINYHHDRLRALVREEAA